MQVSRCCEHGVVTQSLGLVLLVCKDSPLLFCFIFGAVFLLKHCKKGFLGCSGRINIGEKCGKGKRRMWGQQDFFRGGIFGVFFAFFLLFLQGVQRKLNFDNQKKLLLP